MIDLKVNKRYRNIDRIKTLKEEHKYYLWWFDEYYSSSWNDDDDDDRYIYYEIKGNIRYEPSIDYWIIDMDSIYETSEIRRRKIESLLDTNSKFRYKNLKTTLGDYINNDYICKTN